MEYIIAQNTPIAKLSMPKCSNVFLRKRLFRLLDHGRKKPVIWISGPPGSGKTTLISSYIESRSLPHLWYQIDIGDTDVVSFFNYMHYAVKRFAPRRKKTLPFLTPEYLPGLSAFTYRYFEELFGIMKPQSCLVLDNYQEVSADSQLHQIICDLLSVVPEGINVICISRGKPPAPLAKMLLNSEMGMIDWKELILSPDESNGIALLKIKGSKRIKGKLSKEVSDAIIQKAQGWAAAIVLLVDKLKNSGIDTKNLKDLTLETTSDYFESEVFNHLEDETIDFLQKSAIFSSMDVSMAQELTGNAKSGHILSELNRRNFFTEKMVEPIISRWHTKGIYKSPHLFKGVHGGVSSVGTQSIYQYHPIFREFLLSRLTSSYSSEEISAIHRKAAIIIEQAGRIEEAVELLCKSAGWDAVTEIIMKHANSLIEHGRYNLLEKWITAIPSEIRESNPWLTYWHSISILPLAPPLAVEMLEQALIIFKKQRDPTGMLMSLSVILNTFPQLAGDFKMLNRLLEVLNKVITEYGYPEDKNVEVFMISSMVSALVFGAPLYPDLMLWIDRGYKVLKEDMAIPQKIKIQIMSSLAFHEISIGNLVKAQIIIDMLPDIENDNTASPIDRLLINWVRTFFFQTIGTYENFINNINYGLNLAKETGIHIFSIQVMTNGTNRALNENDFTTADRFLKEIYSHKDKWRKTDKYPYHILMTQRALLKGNLKEASFHISQCVELIEDVEFPIWRFILHLLKAHTKLGQGDYEEALRNLDEGYNIALKLGNNTGIYLFLLTYAKIAFDRGENERGLTFLREVMELGRLHGFYYPFFWYPAIMAELCGRALEAGIEAEYVTGLIKTRNIIPNHGPHYMDYANENWPYPVKINAFGPLYIEINGNPITFSRKVQKKPLDLLMVIIALGEKDVAEDLLIDVLWPESDGDAAHEAFKINLHRLRTLLGIEKALNHKGGRLSLDSRYCRIDTASFLSLIEKAETMLIGNNKDNAAELFKKALGMYKGDFLFNKKDIDCISVSREQLKNKFLKYTGILSRLYEEKGELDAAVDILEKGIETEPVAEEFYQRIILIHHKTGRRSEAIRKYQHLQKHLSLILGIEPAPSTQAIYKKIVTNS